MAIAKKISEKIRNTHENERKFRLYMCMYI